MIKSMLNNKKKIYIKNVLDVNSFVTKDGTEMFKYAVLMDKWDEEKQKYDGYNYVSVYSQKYHKFGDVIYITYEKSQFGKGRFIEATKDEETAANHLSTDEEELPFN